jgi:hypothetical protein
VDTRSAAFGTADRLCDWPAKLASERASKLGRQATAVGEKLEFSHVGYEGACRVLAVRGARCCALLLAAAVVLCCCFPSKLHLCASSSYKWLGLALGTLTDVAAAISVNSIQPRSKSPALTLSDSSSSSPALFPAALPNTHTHRLVKKIIQKY